MVIPFGDPEAVQTMLRLTKQADGSTTQETFANFSFVPMKAGKER